MSTDAQPQVVRSYLAGLEAALSDVPSEVSREIVAGIAEELAGLDAATAAARIEALGDPVFIAAEARGGVAAPMPAPTPAPTPAPAAAPAPPRPQDPRWYTVLAGLLVSVGGIVVPFLGWFVGIALVWLSKSWRTWEKWVATLTPFVALALSLGIQLIVSAATIAPTPQGFTGPSMDGAFSPNLSWHDGPLAIWNNLLLVVLINVIVGIWLLWRALRRQQSLV